MSRSLARRIRACAASQLAALLALPLLSACNDNSFALVSVLTQSGSVSAVAQFHVVVRNGTEKDDLYYPRQPTANLTLDTRRAVTFSVEFATSFAGKVTFDVEPLDKSGASLGSGSAEVELVREDVVNVNVQVALKGLLCNPYLPATCGAGETCGLLCASGVPAASMCYVASSGQPGQTCTNNGDCAPGLQCFDFASTGCAVKTCLRFCDHDDAACGEAGAFCNVSIDCGTSAPFLACSRPCDPTGTGTTGCASGLACFVYADETTDCACPGPNAAGKSCTQNSDCAAGASCIVPVQAGTGSGTCRAICKLAAPVCPSGTTCRTFDPSKRNLYGYCE